MHARPCPQHAPCHPTLAPAPPHSAAKYSLESPGVGFMVAAPGVQPAGQTSSGLFCTYLHVEGTVQGFEETWVMDWDSNGFWACCGGGARVWGGLGPACAPARPREAATTPAAPHDPAPDHGKALHALQGLQDAQGLIHRAAEGQVVDGRVLHHALRAVGDGVEGVGESRGANGLATSAARRPPRAPPPTSIKPTHSPNTMRASRSMMNRPRRATPSGDSTPYDSAIVFLRSDTRG